MRMKIYNFLVNRHSGIRQTYHRLHDNADKVGRIKSYAALLGMNAQYYLLRKKEFEMPADTEVYEEKDLSDVSESLAHIRKNELNVEDLVKKLSAFDVISFDVFDTLLLRPFSEPTDLFFFLGEKLGVMDFKRIRTQQEFLARKEHERKKGDNEVTLKEIWKRIEREVGVSAETGLKAELEAEERFCFANAFMLKVFVALKGMGKTIIATSDMYLPSAFVKKLLDKNGFKGITKVYMSCEYGKSKSFGDLYKVLKRDLQCLVDGGQVSIEKHSKVLKTGNAYPRIAHVGDNAHSDVKKAEEADLVAYIYPNVNVFGKNFRAYDMSPLIGGAYRGVVNARLYAGLKKYHPEYEYGYIYGGILVMGYCAFIHEYCKNHDIDRILFLSRDGDIVKRVYDKLYPGESTYYTYMSRAVVTKLMRNHNRYDYLRRFVDYKVNRKIKLKEVLDGMGLSCLKTFLVKETKQNVLGPDTYLTSENLNSFKDYLMLHFADIDKEYKDLDIAAKCYYTSLLSGSARTVVIDIGWAGSAAVSLSVLAKRDWGLDTDIIGLVVGTNTLHNSEPDSAEEFLQSGRLVPYAFSQSLNRDIMKKHDPNKGYNVFWELLFSSPTRQFTGFSIEAVIPNAHGKSQQRKLIEIDGKKLSLHFGSPDANIKGTKHIQKGILDFVSDYHDHFKDLSYMFNITGRDAAAPMLLAASHNERYLKGIAKRFDVNIDV